MKQHKKNFAKLFLFSLALLLFFACQAPEDYANKHEHHHKYSIEYVSIEKIPKIIPSVQQFNKSYGFLSRSYTPNASIPLTNLNLDLSKVLVFTKLNGMVSYSIPILNTNLSNNSFENLHVINDNENTFILRWTADYGFENSFNLNNFTGKVERFDINYQMQTRDYYVNGQRQPKTQSIAKSNGGNETFDYYLDCYTEISCACIGSGATYCGCDGSYGQCQFSVSQVCMLAGGGGTGSGSGSGTGGTGGTGGGGGGSGSNDGGSSTGDGETAEEVVPNPPKTAPLDEKKCALFNKLKIDQPFKDVIQVLKNGVNLTYEQGIALTNQPNGTYSAIIGTANPNNEYAVEYNIPNGTIIDIFVHNHYAGGLSIFSPDDLEQMYKYIKNIPTDDYNPNFISIVVTPNQEVYAMTITDKNAFIAFGDEWLSTPEKFNGFRELFYSSLVDNRKPGYGINKNHTPSDNEKNFMRLLNRNSSIKIHKANADLSQWTPLKLNTSNTVINETPCN